MGVSGRVLRGFRVQGLGFRGFRVEGLVYAKLRSFGLSLELRVSALRFEIWDVLSPEGLGWLWHYNIL